MAYLYKVTATQSILAKNSSTMIPAGASVEIPKTLPERPFPSEIQEAFMRKYGLRPTTEGCQGLMKIEQL
ncbi:hypothetical protein [uncultured Bacteroides sp.]|uniref:hypothetical protein n=1 Tax=uncultured Bacteroides sp. TaxID=162156 RepID=UPI00322055EF